MNKKDLVEVISKKHKITKTLAEDVLKTFIGTVKTTVKKGGTVRLVGFGTFKKTVRKARKGFNPSTKTKIKIPRKTVAKFSASKTWKIGR